MRLAWLLALIATAAAAEPLPLHLPATVCCCKDFERRLVVELGVVDAAGVQVRAEPEPLATVSLRPLGEHRVEIHLQARGDGRGTLELLDRNHARLVRSDLQTIAMTTDCERHIGSEANLPDGSVLFHGQLILKPYVAGLDVRFACLSQQVTVPDGLAERWIASETFTPMPDGSAQTSFRMLRQPKAKWVPFTYIIYQDGEQISAP